jgi:hypothetical protein
MFNTPDCGQCQREAAEYRRSDTLVGTEED